MEWMKDLTRQTKEDPRYQSLLKDALALEEAFASFRQGLPEDQRALLDRCLSLWEEMDHLMLLHAYVLGRGNRK